MRLKSLLAVVFLGLIAGSIAGPLAGQAAGRRRLPPVPPPDGSVVFNTLDQPQIRVVVVTKAGV